MAMKIVGIIGGIGPQSTIEYYSKIVSGYLGSTASGNYPQIIINSINMKKMLDMIASGQFAEVTDFLLAEVTKLKNAGADFAVLASNTPHIVFDRVAGQASLPLISIVEATRARTIDAGLSRVGLFGTKFTMQGSFYQEEFSQHGIEVLAPDEIDQSYIHEKYMGELIDGIILDETKSGLLSIIDKMKLQQNIQGLILGGTELPLIIRSDDVADVCILDTTAIHVESILKQLEQT
jgi:aspartate racemase